MNSQVPSPTASSSSGHVSAEAAGGSSPDEIEAGPESGSPDSSPSAGRSADRRPPVPDTDGQVAMAKSCQNPSTQIGTSFRIRWIDATWVQFDATFMQNDPRIVENEIARRFGHTGLAFQFVVLPTLDRLSVHRSKCPGQSRVPDARIVQGRRHEASAQASTGARPSVPDMGRIPNKQSFVPPPELSSMMDFQSRGPPRGRQAVGPGQEIRNKQSPRPPPCSTSSWPSNRSRASSSQPPPCLTSSWPRDCMHTSKLDSIPVWPPGRKAESLVPPDYLAETRNSNFAPATIPRRRPRLLHQPLSPGVDRANCIHPPSAQDVSDKVFMQAVWKLEILVSVIQGKCHPELQEKFEPAAPQIWYAVQPLLSRSEFSNQVVHCIWMSLCINATSRRRIFS